MTPPVEARAAQALERWLAEFGPRLRAIVLARSPPSRGLDSDAVEQVLRTRLREALARGEVVAHPAAWLYRTAMDVIVERLREGAATSSDAGPDEVMAGSGDAALLRVLASAVESLPERQRQPVQLHLQGFGFAETARLLAITEASARSLVSRGMDDLRERLAAQGWP